MCFIVLLISFFPRNFKNFEERRVEGVAAVDEIEVEA